MPDAATAQLNATLNIDSSVAWPPERGGPATVDNTLLYVKYVITGNSEWRIGLRFRQPRCAIGRRNQGGRVGPRAQKVYLRTLGSSGSMQRVSSAELVRSFSVHTDAALAEPIVITRNGRDRLVILNVDLYRDILALALLHKGGTRIAEEFRALSVG